MSTEAIAHYEAALKEAFPSGATGDVFYHWDEARKALASEANEQPAQQEPAAWFYRDNLGRPCSTTKRPLSPFKDMQPLYFGHEFTCSTGLCHYRKENT